MIEALKTSLEYQDLCPRCGSNWVELENLLHNPLCNPDRYMALMIINQCPTCIIRFEGRLSSEIYQIRKGG